MKEVLLLLILLKSVCLSAQVTYFKTNNYFLYFLTDTGFSSYDWRYEPLKTDVERGQLHGNVSKVVTTIIDKTNRGFGELFNDTTYYDNNGNITKILAPKNDKFEPNIKFNPDSWTYTYNSKGVLTSYVWQTEKLKRDNAIGVDKHVHTMVIDNQGRIIKEKYKAYERKGNNWSEFGGPNDDTWSFKYDGNGKLIGGFEYLHRFNLTYQNGQLTKMLSAEQGAKPVTFTYNENGLMTKCISYQLDEWDGDEFRYEYEVTMNYNNRGHVVSATKNTWEHSPKWARIKIQNTETYDVSYTYDDKGNWTKAVMFVKSKNEARKAIFTITRTISYR